MKKKNKTKYGILFKKIAKISTYIIIAIIAINCIKIKADSYEYPFTYAYITNYYGDQAGAYALPQIGDNQIMDFFGYNLGGSMYGGSFNKSFYFPNQNVDNKKIARFYLYYTDNSYILDSPKSQISIFAKALTQTENGTLLYNACTFNSIGNGNNFGYIDCSIEKNSHIMYGLNFMIRIEGTAPSDYSFGVSSMVSFSHLYTTPSNTDTILNTINNSINNQTSTITQNQNQNTQEIKDTINQNTTYQDKSDKYTNETREMDEYKNKEEQLMEGMNFTALDNLDITINPETNNFIWRIVEGLRGISSKIVLLMTSVLGLGIIKMILNR